MNSVVDLIAEQQAISPWGIGEWKRPNIVVALYLVVNSLIGVLILLLTNGNYVAAIIPSVLSVILLASFFRLDWGLYIFVALVIVADQYPPRGLQGITFQISYFRNLKEIPYLPYFDAGVVNPLELHLFTLFGIWILLGIVRRRFDFVGVQLWAGYALFFLWFIFSFIWGKAHGGEFLPALWEMRALCYFALVYFFVPQIIRSTDQIRTLFWVLIATISFKAFQGIIVFISLGFQTWGYDSLTNSEDPVFMIVLIFILFGLSLLGGDHKQKRALKWLLFPLLVGIYVGQRRATYASFCITLIAFAILLPTKESKIFRKYLLIGIVFFALYLGAFWNTYGRLGMVAQQFKAAFIKDPAVISGRDYLSNLYRDYENYNLAMTIRRAPIVGIGFGNMYDNPMSFYGIERMMLLGYIPHDSVLWLYVKTGSIGFFLFFLFLDSFIFYGAMLFGRCADPYYRVVIAVCVLAIINQVVVTFVEMQFTYYRNMVLLGILMGLMPSLRNFVDKSHADA